jgi:hypothetical protein
MEEKEKEKQKQAYVGVGLLLVILFFVWIYYSDRIDNYSSCVNYCVSDYEDCTFLTIIEDKNYNQYLPYDDYEDCLSELELCVFEIKSCVLECQE